MQKCLELREKELNDLQESYNTLMTKVRAGVPEMFRVLNFGI